MRKQLGFLVLLATQFLGQTAQANITGSKHDFAGESWNPGGQICQVCHTPHNAKSAAGYAPLWNHTITTATFTPYNSVTLNASVGQPQGVSKLCLSCHDGTVALEAFGTATTGSNFVNGEWKLGTDLSNDHPVSFTYNTALATADGTLFDPATKVSGISPSGTIQSDMLVGGNVECSTCHDVHNGANNGAGSTSLLVKSNVGSALCLTCHNK